MNDATRSRIESLARADLLLLLAVLLASPRRQPADGSEVSDDDLHRAVRAAGLPDETEFLEALRSALESRRATPLDEQRSEYTRLFEGSVTCPINETAFVRRDKGSILADICGFYHAFGFEVDEDGGEKADHLIAELEFAAMLLVMQAEAQRSGDSEHAEITGSALRSFLRDHLNEWLPLFAARLGQVASLACHRHLANAIESIWRSFSVLYDLPATDPASVDASEPMLDEGSPYECDMADAAGDRFVELTTPAASGASMSSSGGASRSDS